MAIFCSKIELPFRLCNGASVIIITIQSFSSKNSFHNLSFEPLLIFLWQFYRKILRFKLKRFGHIEKWLIEEFFLECPKNDFDQTDIKTYRQLSSQIVAGPYPSSNFSNQIAYWYKYAYPQNWNHHKTGTFILQNHACDVMACNTDRHGYRSMAENRT